MASLTLYLRPAGLTMDILGTFCAVFMVQCVCIQLMLRFFAFGVILFDCFVSCQNITCLKRFARYGHNHSQTRSCLLNRYDKN